MSTRAMRSSACVARLLTFWPPGPELEENVNRRASGRSLNPGAISAGSDGSARFVAEDLPLENLQALSTRAGQEVAEVP